MEKDTKRFIYLTSEIEAVYHEAALKFGLSDSALRILYTICLDGDSCLLSEVVRFSAISKQTINSSLRKLEEDGLIYLEAAEGNKKKVCLTEQGKALTAGSIIKIQVLENEIFSSWTEQERTTYIELTQKYLNAITAKIKEL